ncbi:MAG: glycosyltransferase family 1 protein [bacterium]|nr:glycosyltransferase family 1 protein [bacterium]
MKIGIDARLWNESGVGRYTRNLVDQLQVLDKKNEYVLFVQSRDHDNIKYHLQCKQMSNVKWKIVDVDIRWHTLSEQIKFPSILNKENLDLVHFPYFSIPFFYNKPFVVTIHDLIINHFDTGKASTLPSPVYFLKRFGYDLVLKKAINNSRKIIAVSNTTKKEIIDHFKINEDKIIVTYEGVDEEILKAENKELDISKPYFLYVGNAYPHKNLERLLEAFRLFCHPEASAEGSHEILRFAQNDIRLVLVGKEDYFYKKIKEDIKKNEFGDRVIFYGEANDRELVSLYKNAVALVVPSLMEGFGLPALEAMACGCLVLASEIDSLKEVCVDSAIYFNPFDENDLENKLKLIINLKNKSVYVKKGIERSKLFSWEKMARETLKVYESCISL